MPFYTGSGLSEADIRKQTLLQWPGATIQSIKSFGSIYDPAIAKSRGVQAYLPGNYGAADPNNLAQWWDVEFLPGAQAPFGGAAPGQVASPVAGPPLAPQIEQPPVPSSIPPGYRSTISTGGVPVPGYPGTFLQTPPTTPGIPSGVTTKTRQISDFPVTPVNRLATLAGMGENAATARGTGYPTNQGQNAAWLRWLRSRVGRTTGY